MASWPYLFGQRRGHGVEAGALQLGAPVAGSAWKYGEYVVVVAEAGLAVPQAPATIAASSAAARRPRAAIAGSDRLIRTGSMVEPYPFAGRRALSVRPSA